MESSRISLDSSKICNFANVSVHRSVLISINVSKHRAIRLEIAGPSRSHKVIRSSRINRSLSSGSDRDVLIRIHPRSMSGHGERHTRLGIQVSQISRRSCKFIVHSDTDQTRSSACSIHTYHLAHTFSSLPPSLSPLPLTLSLSYCCVGYW